MDGNKPECKHHWQQAKLFEITTLYRAGRPFKTEAVVFDTGTLRFTDAVLPAAFLLEQEAVPVPRTVITLQLQAEDRIFGLGATLGSLNKRGKKYTLFNTDDSLHTPDKESLYGSQPFLLITGRTELGLFIDYPGKIVFDLGFSDHRLLTITITALDFDFYLFETGDKKLLLKEFLQLTGAPYLPPQWAFGYQQSRWSYPTASSVEEVVLNLRTNKIPCDVIYFDIDYLKDYKVFTIDPGRFPEVGALLAKLKTQGIKVIPIIDPGVKIEEQYELYREGKKAGCFCLDEKGEDFIGAVWPGPVVFPDFFNHKTRRWWAEHCRQFLELGFSGFWNDMNEPAIFYTPAALAQALQSIAGQGNAPGTAEFFRLRGIFKKLSHCEDDYRRFYHITDEGEKINHWPVHNLYGYYMVKATAGAITGVAAADPAAFAAAPAGLPAGVTVPALLDSRQASALPATSRPRLFILSRSNCVGLHRLAAVWTGDNHSWWEHMFQNIQMLVSLNICGFLYAGADIGGFSGNASAELVIRWTQLGVFNPLFRNHSAAGTRPQEPFAFDAETTAITRRAIEFRYALLPYLYSEMLTAVIRLTPLIKPLCFEFADAISPEIEDEFLWGGSLLVAPVHKANSKSRFIYLPEVKWLAWKVRDYRERDCRIYQPGPHYLPVALDEIPVFIRENTMLLLTAHQNYIGEKAITELTLIAFVTHTARYTYCVDDGLTMGYQQGEYATIDFVIERQQNGYNIVYTIHPCASVPLALTRFNFEIYDEQGHVFKKTLTEQDKIRPAG